MQEQCVVNAEVHHGMLYFAVVYSFCFADACVYRGVELEGEPHNVTVILLSSVSANSGNAEGRQVTD